MLKIFFDGIRCIFSHQKGNIFSTKFNQQMKLAKFHPLFLLKLTLIIFISLDASVAHTQVFGCKDPLANNYNAAATVNNGSCTYNTTNYTPPVKVDPINDILVETSGLQWAGNSLWSFNDGGGAAAIYRMDTLTNTIFQTVNLSGATNVDWEDIAFDGTYFYVGDFGNSAGGRTDLKIYKFPLSAIPDYVSTPVATIPAGQIEVINFIYNDQPQPPVAVSLFTTKFDCEAMIVDGGKIHIFSKNWVDVNTTHYEINSTVAGNFVAMPLETLATTYLVTAADKALGQQTVALLGYQPSGTGNHYMHLLNDYSGGNYFNGNKRRINLPDATSMGQGEGITFRNATYGYISNERFQYPVGPATVTVNHKLRSFDINSFIPQYILPLELKNFSVSNVNGTHKISWSFEAFVQNVEIQQSSNGTNFASLQNYTRSAGDLFYNKSVSPISYYRIAWQKNDGTQQYSNIISIKNEDLHNITDFLLKSNGELNFTINGQSTNYSVELISTDGKLISTSAMHTYKPGRNKVSFNKALVKGLVYVSIYNGTQKSSTLLQVTD